VKTPTVTYNVVNIWGGSDLPGVLEQAAHYIRGLEPTSTVEHVIATEDGSQGWFVTLVVRLQQRVERAA
jgi:hypothetical protein